MSASLTRSLEKKRYAALVLAQSWQIRGMLCPMALPIWANSWRNLLPSRASRNSHPAASRSTQHSPVDVGLRSASRQSIPQRQAHRAPPSVPNKVLSNKSQAILSTQHFDLRLSQPKGLELWVIESFTGRVPPRCTRGEALALSGLQSAGLNIAARCGAINRKIQAKSRTRTPLPCMDRMRHDGLFTGLRHCSSGIADCARVRPGRDPGQIWTTPY